MQPEDLLSVSAEISIAILGFAAIASVLRGGQSSLTPDARFWGMLALAFVGLVSSLGPLPFLATEISQDTIWGIASALLGLAMFSLTLFAILATTGANQRAGVSTNLVILVSFATMMGLTALLAFYNSGIFNSPQFSLYFGSVVAVLIITAAVFIRMLAVWLGNDP